MFFPVRCLPLPGREGVTLIAGAENMRIMKKKRISHENRNIQI